jgi:hypothetical protein
MTPVPLDSRLPGTGARLDNLIASRFLSGRWASRVWSSSDLPSRLSRCVGSLTADSEWRAYSDGERIFFAIAREHTDESQVVSATAIDVYFLDDSAAIYSAGVWEYDSKHGWWLDAVLDLSYDCDHGWWHDALLNTGGRKQPAAAAPLRIEGRVKKRIAGSSRSPGES